MFNKPLNILPETEQFSEELFKKLYEWEEYLFVKELSSQGKEDIGDPKALFQVMFETELDHNRTMPDEIKNKIADLRVFTLGYATQEVIDLISKKEPPRK